MGLVKFPVSTPPATVSTSTGGRRGPSLVGGSHSPDLGAISHPCRVYSVLGTAPDEDGPVGPLPLFGAASSIDRHDIPRGQVSRRVATG